MANTKSLVPIVDLTDETRESAKAVYERLESDRKSYITRAETNAQYTIPSLFPKESDTGSTEYMINNQSVGARGLNNLASKLLLALFPPNSPFFRLTMQDQVKQEMTQVDPKVQQQVDQTLMQLEQKISKYIETRQIRVTINEALKQLIVAGNCLIFLPPDVGGAKLYRLYNYVISRDALGNILQIVTKDKLTYATSPQEVQQLLNTSDGTIRKPDEEIIIYTHIFRDGDQYYAYQEVEEQIIQGTEQQFPIEKSPWLALRMTKIDGESYGRSYIEEYIGDLKSLDGLQEALLNGAALASFDLFLVNPTGLTQVRRVAKAKSGDMVAGRPEDIGRLQTGKGSDLQVVKATADALEARLSYIFMLNSAVQRQGERVTAEEIRYVAGELEDTLGGTYSILSQELQLPLVRRLMAQLESTGEIPSLPDNSVEPAITTGLEALGRGHDLNKLQMFMEMISTIPEAAQYVRMSSYLLMSATSLGIDTTGLIKTDEEIAQEQQQAMMMQLGSQAIPNATKGMMDGLNNEINNQQQQGE